MSDETKHPLVIWLHESRWKLTDEGRLNEDSKEILQNVIGFYEMTSNIEYMANKGWLERK